MNLDLSGKRAVVCGSTQGIGKATAIELSLLGASITLISRNEEKLKITLKELHAGNGQRHEYIVADFNDAETLNAKVLGYAAKNKVHVLINNTGGPPPGLAIDATATEFLQAFSSHLLCNQLLVQAFVHSMKEEKYGRIINIISTSVKTPLRGLGVSNTIRGAVANWSKTLSAELAPFGITVNNALPGWIMTSRLESVISGRIEKTGKTFEEIKNEIIGEIPAGRIGDPHDIGSAIAFLATPAAGYINGINLPVDGGKTPTL